MRSNTAEKPMTMSRATSVAYRPEPRPEPAVTLQPLMTPARRLALEALEREFHELLQSKSG
jgi:hypothetical protein